MFILKIIILFKIFELFLVDMVQGGDELLT